MKPNLHSTHTLIALTMILVTTIRFPAIGCHKTRPYNVHGNLVNIRLGYLFNHNCIHNHESLDYRFLEMNNNMQTTTISRNDLWSNFFPQYLHNITYKFGHQNASLHYGCDSSVNGLRTNSSMQTIVTIARDGIYNTTYNSTLFNENSFSHEDLSLYHGCNSSMPGVLFGSNYEFGCHVNGNRIGNYFYRTILIDRNMIGLLLRCNDHVIVSMNQSLDNRLVSNRMIGLNLRWIANWCESNSTSLELSDCYCSSESFSLAPCNNSNKHGGFKRAVKKFSWKWKLVVGFSCGTIGITLLLVVILYQKRRLRKTQKAENHQIEMFIRNCTTLAPKRYKYSEIKKTTNSFQVKLGQGGYGSVYKGKLSNGQLVAVKLLSEAMGNGQDFFNEVASISRTSHVNIVTLLGFCIEGKKRALIYEFMPNGSLDRFLCGDHDGIRLDWNTLFRIAKGIARGLEYLHQGCNTRIVHFDIKPHNILLDEQFVPKLSDFGLAKLCTRRESIVSVTGARGTVGYMAPEVFLKSFGGVSHKSDVYSYGMMVIEMTGAHKNNNASLTSTSETYFPDWIYKLVEGGDNLGVYGAETEEEKDLAKKMMMVSLWCIQSGPSDRPSISKVVEMLEGSFESLQVPSRNFLSSSPTLPGQAISTFATKSSIKERVLTVHTTNEFEDISL